MSSPAFPFAAWFGKVMGAATNLAPRPGARNRARHPRAGATSATAAEGDRPKRARSGAGADNDSPEQLPTKQTRSESAPKPNPNSLTQLCVFVELTAAERECYTKVHQWVVAEFAKNRNGQGTDAISTIAEDARRAAVHPSALLPEALLASCRPTNLEKNKLNKRFNIKAITAVELAQSHANAHEGCLEVLGSLNTDEPTLPECPVCTNHIADDLIMLHCKHFVCRECLLLVYKQRGKKTCPECRANIYSKPKYEIVFNSRTFCGESYHYWQDLAMKAMDSSRIGAILTIIESGAENDQIVIFSQYLAFIRRIHEALAARHVNVEVIDGAAESAFRVAPNNTPPRDEDKSLCVFLVSSLSVMMTSGSRLVAANHLILVEAPLNQTMEKWFVRRRKQERPWTIHRLIARDTVEEKIHDSSVAGQLLWHDMKDSTSYQATAQIMELFAE